MKEQREISKAQQTY